jgi:hypothetical protein
MMADDFKDPLDEEFKCTNCEGAGGWDEGGEEDGVMRGNPDDFVTCFTCMGSGSVEPSHHPGKDGSGARAMNTFDIREPTHVEQYDVENAMPHGNMAVRHGEGEILDPYRQGFPRDSPVKQTRVPIATEEQIASTHPSLRHRLPSVYMRELNGQPSNTGLNITGAGHPLFTRSSNPMQIAWLLLKGDY